MTRPAQALLAVLTTALLAAVACVSCADEGPPLRPVAVDGQPDGVAELQVAGRAVTVELARDDQERELGLMHRASLGEDAGMLFLFTEESYRRFWMRNTLIPLDIIFLDADGVVINVREAQAGVEQPGYTSLAPAQFVLELNLGWCARHGLVAGDRIEIPEALRAQAEPTSRF